MQATTPRSAIRSMRSGRSTCACSIRGAAAADARRSPVDPFVGVEAGLDGPVADGVGGQPPSGLGVRTGPRRQSVGVLEEDAVVSGIDIGERETARARAGAEPTVGVELHPGDGEVVVSVVSGGRHPGEVGGAAGQQDADLDGEFAIAGAELDEPVPDVPLEQARLGDAGEAQSGGIAQAAAKRTDDVADEGGATRVVHGARARRRHPAVIVANRARRPQAAGRRGRAHAQEMDVVIHEGRAVG